MKVDDFLGEKEDRPVLIEVLKTESEYRKHPAMNYSKLKWWVSHTPLSWRKKFILGEKSEEDPDNKGLTDGKLVDIVTLGSEEDFNRDYFIAEVDKLPSPQVVTFCNILWELTKECVDEEGVMQCEFRDLFEEAYNKAEIKSTKLPKWTENFETNGGKEYYELLRNCNDRVILSSSEVMKAEGAKESLFNDPNLGYLFRGDGVNQLPIVFEYKGKQYKALIDRLSADKENKILRPFDLKTTYEPNEFEYQYFKMKYYIQNGIYDMAVQAYRDKFYPDWDIWGTMPFVVIDAQGFNRPLEFQFNFTNGGNPWVGFTRREREYKGILEIMDEIEWHTENNEWRIKKKHLDNNSKITIEI